MSISTMKLRDALAKLDADLRDLLGHPEATSQDKASIILASTSLSEIGRRHMGRWTPVNPATLPPRKAGQGYPQMPQGWAKDWEDAQDVANA